MKILNIASFASQYFPAFRDENTNIVQGFTGKKLSVFTSGDFYFREYANRLDVPVSPQMLGEGMTGLRMPAN